MESLKVYSQSCVTVSLAYDGSYSSLPSSIFFFQQLEAFPVWACDLPISNNSLGSHNHSPQPLQVSKWAQSTCCLPVAPELCRSSTWWRQRKGWPATREGLWACSKQWKHRIWLSLSRPKLTLGGLLVKSQKPRTPKMPGGPRHSDDLCPGLCPGRKVKCWLCQCRVMSQAQWPFQKQDSSHRNGLSSAWWSLAQLALWCCQERKTHKRCGQILWQQILTSSSLCARQAWPTTNLQNSKG